LKRIHCQQKKKKKKKKDFRLLNAAAEGKEFDYSIDNLQVITFIQMIKININIIITLSINIILSL